MRYRVQIYFIRYDPNSNPSNKNKVIFETFKRSIQQKVIKLYEFQYAIKDFKNGSFRKENLSSCLPFQQGIVTREWLCLSLRCSLIMSLKKM